MDKFSKLMGLGSWFTKWILPPHPPKGKDFKKMRWKISNFETQFYFPTSLSQSKEHIGSEILLQNYVYGLSKKN